MQANADTLIATRFDTVIYDLDGTLIDSARDMREAISRVLADHGLPPISDEDARIFMGQGSKVTMGKAFSAAASSARELMPKNSASSPCSAIAAWPAARAMATASVR